MNKILTLFKAIVLFLGITATANATTISYDIINLSGSTWEYSYTVENNSLAGDIDEFTVWFDYTLYENLAVTSSLSDWDEIAIPTDTTIPDDGFYDAYALFSGIAPGASETGYFVSFDWLGTGTPGSQPFDIVDPITYDTLDSGDTSLASAPIPEPSTVFLMGIGLVGLAVVSLRFKRQKLAPFKVRHKETLYRNT
jgi:hypothetical protein